MTELPELILNFSKIWGRPRGDLCLWISVLNRHDTILQDMIKKYGLQSNNTKPVLFEQDDEKLISSILVFTTFLLSNSSNRGIFNSEAHIYKFLYCTSPSLISGALKVCVTLAIHYVNVRPRRTVFSMPEILQITRYCTSVSSTYNGSLLDFINNSNSPAGFSIQYYMRGVSSAHAPTPSKSRKSNSSSGNRILSNNAPKEGLTEYIISAKDAIEMPTDVLLNQMFSVLPEEYWQEAIVKLFVAKSTASTEDGFKLRCLLAEMQCDALAIAGYSFSSTAIDNRIMQEHPHLIRHICQLILPENFVSHEVRNAAIDTFCALTCQASLVADIVVTLSSHVNHGPLMIVVRQLIKDLKRKHEVNQDFMDGVTSLVLQLSNFAQSGSMVTTTSDLLPLLIELVKVGSAVPRARTNALDSMMHVIVDSPTSMANFIQEQKGCEIAMQFYEEAIESYMIPSNRGSPPQYCSPDSSISYYQSQWLKNVIHLIASIAANGRAQDKIHITLESNFIPLTAKLVSHPEVFGSRIVILALAILGNAIETESSTVQVMNEKDPGSIIIKSIPHLLNYSSSFFTPVVKFYTSLFHNATGLAFNKEHGLLEQLFKALDRPIDSKVNYKSLGSAFDIFISEHASLRATVITHSIELIKSMKESIDIPVSEMYYFSETEHVLQENNMEVEVQAARNYASLTSAIGFVEGLLKNAHSQREFIQQKGVKALLDYFDLKSLNYDFIFSPLAMSLCLTIKNLFDLDIEREYIANEILSYFETVLAKVDVTSRSVGNFQEDDMIESKNYKNYLRMLGPLNNVMYCFYMTVFTHYGTGYRIIDVMKQIARLDVEKSFLPRLGEIQRKAIWEDSRITQHISPGVRDATRALSLDDVYGNVHKRLQDTEDVKKLKELEEALKEEANTERFFLVKSGRFLLNGIIYSVSKLFYEMSCFLFKPRMARVPEKASYKLFASIANVFVQHLEAFDYTTTSEVHMRYLVDSLTCLQKVMYKPHGKHLILSQGVFIFFKQQCGILKMTKILEQLFELEASESDNSITAGALKVLLILTSYMATSSSVIDNSISGTSWGQDDVELPNFFSQGQFFLECRTTVFDSILRLWSSSKLHKKPSSVTNLVISMVSSLFDCSADKLVDDTKSWRGCHITAEEAPPSEKLVKAISAQKGIDSQTAETHLIQNGNDYRLLVSKKFCAPLDVTFKPTTFSVPENENGPMVHLSNLNELRDRVLLDALDRAINLLREHPKNVFAVSAFISKINTYEVRNSDEVQPFSCTAVTQVVLAISSMDPHSKSEEKVLTAYCHVLGFLLNDINILYASLESMIEYTPTFVTLLETDDAINKDWFPHALLILELVLTVKEVPEEPVLPSQAASREKPSPSKGIPTTSPLAAGLADRVFDALLKIDVFPSDVTILAINRLLAFFTRDFARAKRLRNSPFLLKLIQSFKSFSVKNQNNASLIEQFRTTTILILRHIVETETVVYDIMRACISKLFGHRSLADKERDLYDIIYAQLPTRSCKIFLEVIEEFCMLSELSDPKSSKLSLKTSFHRTIAPMIEEYNEIVSASPEDKGDIQTEELSSLRDILSPSSSQHPMNDRLKPISENDGVISMLLSELTDLKPSDIYTVPEKTEDAIRIYVQLEESKKDEKKDTNPTSKKFNSHHFYACFLMQNLTELLASYTSCKHDFVKFSTRIFSEEKSDTKARAVSALGFFLNDLLPVGVINTSNSLPSNEWAEISALAGNAIISLVSTPDDIVRESEDEIQNAPQLVKVREAAVDGIAKAFKEASKSTANLDWRYSKLFALSELCYRMMSSKLSRYTTPPGQLFDFHDGPANGKLLYDKDFAVILTGILSDIDLNYPDSRRPIRSLTKSLNKLSRLTMEVSQLDNEERQVEEALDEQLGDVSYDEDGYDEEVPDIFRNSTLGMFEAGEAMYDMNEDDIMEEESDSQIAEEEEDDAMDFDEDELSDVDSAIANDTPDEVVHISSDSGDMSDSEDDEEEEDEDEEEEDNDDIDSQSIEEVSLDTIFY